MYQINMTRYFITIVLTDRWFLLIRYHLPSTPSSHHVSPLKHVHWLRYYIHRHHWSTTTDTDYPLPLSSLVQSHIHRWIKISFISYPALPSTLVQHHPYDKHQLYHRWLTTLSLNLICLSATAATYTIIDPPKHRPLPMIHTQWRHHWYFHVSCVFSCYYPNFFNTAARKEIYPWTAIQHYHSISIVSCR